MRAKPERFMSQNFLKCLSYIITLLVKDFSKKKSYSNFFCSGTALDNCFGS